MPKINANKAEYDDYNSPVEVDLMDLEPYNSSDSVVEDLGDEDYD